MHSTFVRCARAGDRALRAAGVGSVLLAACGPVETRRTTPPVPAPATAASQVATASTTSAVATTTPAASVGLAEPQSATMECRPRAGVGNVTGALACAEACKPRSAFGSCFIKDGGCDTYCAEHWAAWNDAERRAFWSCAACDPICYTTIDACMANPPGR